MSILNNSPTVVFDGNDLNQVPGLTIVNRDYFSDPTRVINSQKLARTNKSVLTTAEYQDKMIAISVVIVRNSRTEAEASSDTLNSLIQGVERPLQITQNGETRYYTATLDSSSIDSQPDNSGINTSIGGFLRKTLNFICSDPFGYDASASTLLSDVAITNSTAALGVSVGGSFKVSPVITLTINSITGGTGGQVVVTNASTGLGITLSEDFVAGDVIVIDGDSGDVSYNGVVVDVSGKIPEFYPGLRQISYTDNFTARNVTISAVYTRKWL